MAVMHLIRTAGLWLLSRVERLFSLVFTPAWNPFYHLGALTIFFFWVILVTGIYVFIFFETSVFGAYPSVEYMTHEQWYAGGVMRSLHRYASDAAIITITLHIVKEFLMDRYRGVRWFSWFTGVPLLWLVFPLGITGYWLVWDKLGHYVAIASSELLDVLPIFADPMARNFLSAEALSDRFFTFMAFLHLLGLPVFLIFGIWFHLLRISRPTVNPPMGLAVGSLAALTLLSLIYPALSQGPADVTTVPTELGLDWFYLVAYPLLKTGSPALVWGVLVGTSLVLSLAPWLPPARRRAAAVVDLGNCNGCGRCVDDCPYNAVSMGPRTDGSLFEQEAVVNASLCTSCGICAGACPTSTPYRRKSELVPGIDLPNLPIRDLRESTLNAAAGLEGEARVLVYACDSNPAVRGLRKANVEVVTLNCMAQLPPAFLDFVLTRGHADGVFLLGCRENDCDYRFGIQWVDQRLAGERDPYLRKRVPLERIRSFWGGRAPLTEVRRELETFREHIRALGPFQARAPEAPQTNAVRGES